MQKYNIPYRLAKILAKKDCQMLRNSLRLWVFLKTYEGDKATNACFYLTKLRPVLLQYFSYRQINTYLDYLIRHGWMGKDKNGKYYLRGRTMLFAYCDAQSSMLSVQVDHSSTLSQKAWVGFLSAAVVCGVQRAIRKATDPQLVKEAATPWSGGISSCRDHREGPLSCANIAQSVDVSMATASRMRKRAADAGLIKNRWAFKPTPFAAHSPGECRSLRATLNASMPAYAEQVRLRRNALLRPSEGRWRTPEVYNPDALRLGVKRNGTVWEQRPNMVTNLGIQFRSMSIGAKNIVS